MSNQNIDILDKFPTVSNGVIDLETFLNASKGMVNLIDDLGRLFRPLSYDMSNNITKIQSGNEKIGGKKSLEDLLSAEREQNESMILVAVVWLARALRFLKIFFQCLIDERDGSESLESTMVRAYQGSLERYHGWMTRQLFSFFVKVCPPRTATLAILERRLGTSDVITELNIFAKQLDLNLHHIDSYFVANGFNCELIVP